MIQDKAGDEDDRLDRSALYGIGAAIGFPPRVVDEMTTWELAACVDGFNLANGGEPAVEPPSPEEFDEMLIKHGWVASATQH